MVPFPWILQFFTTSPPRHVSTFLKWAAGPVYGEECQCKRYSLIERLFLPPLDSGRDLCTQKMRQQEVRLGYAHFITGSFSQFLKFPGLCMYPISRSTTMVPFKCVQNVIAINKNPTAPGCHFYLRDMVRYRKWNSGWQAVKGSFIFILCT